MNESIGTIYAETNHVDAEINHVDAEINHVDKNQDGKETANIESQHDQKCFSKSLLPFDRPYLGHVVSVVSALMQSATVLYSTFNKFGDLGVCDTQRD